MLGQRIMQEWGDPLPCGGSQSNEHTGGPLLPSKGYPNNLFSYHKSYLPKSPALSKVALNSWAPKHWTQCCRSLRPVRFLTPPPASLVFVSIQITLGRGEGVRALSSPVLGEHWQLQLRKRCGRHLSSIMVFSHAEASARCSHFRQAALQRWVLWLPYPFLGWLWKGEHAFPDTLGFLWSPFWFRHVAAWRCPLQTWWLWLPFFLLLIFLPLEAAGICSLLSLLSLTPIKLSLSFAHICP